MNELNVSKIRGLTAKTQTEFAEIFGVTRHAVALWESLDDKKRTKPKSKYVLKMLAIEKSYAEGNAESGMKKNSEKEKSPFEIEISRIVQKEISNTLTVMQEALEKRDDKLKKISNALAALVLDFAEFKEFQKKKKS